MCFVWIWEQTAVISLYSINWLVFITETQCAYRAVRAEFLLVAVISIHFIMQSLEKSTDFFLSAGYEVSSQFHLHIYSTILCVSISTHLPYGLLEGTTDDFKTGFTSFVNNILTGTGKEAWTWGTEVTTECSTLDLRNERLQPFQRTQSQSGVRKKEREIVWYRMVGWIHDRFTEIVVWKQDVFKTKG